MPLHNWLITTASWTFAKKADSGERLPQAIAHRGYKAAHPENTMGAFRGAIECGAHALETDVHITKDEVVVLSHVSKYAPPSSVQRNAKHRDIQDATMKRCFGKDEKIIDCDWEHLSKERTLREPHEPMPTLKELLEYMATPGLEKIWLLIDIKVRWRTSECPSFAADRR